MKLQRISLSLLVPSPFSANRMSSEDFLKLVANIKRYGEAAIEPIIVSPAPEELWNKDVTNPATGDIVYCREGMYVVVSGWHRVKAAKEAGLEEVPAFVAVMGLEEIRKWTFHYNIRGRNVGVLVFNHVKQLLDCGLEVKDVAEVCGVDEDIVRKIKSSKVKAISSRVVEEILKLSDPGVLTVADCISIAQLSRVEDQLDVIELVRVGGPWKSKCDQLILWETHQSRISRSGQVDSSVVEAAKEVFERSGKLVPDNAVPVVASAPDWMKGDLVRELAGKRRYAVETESQKIMRKLEGEREMLLKMLPEPVREKVEEKGNSLSNNVLRVILSLSDQNMMITLLNRVLEERLSEEEAVKVAEDMRRNAAPQLEREIVLHPSSESYVYTVECRHCGNFNRIKISYPEGGGRVEVKVLEEVGQLVDVVERKAFDEKVEEEFVLEDLGVRVKVDYVNKTVKVSTH